MLPPDRPTQTRRPNPDPVRHGRRLLSPAATTTSNGGDLGCPASPTSRCFAPTQAAAFPVTVTDDEGTATRSPSEPQIIVSLTPANTEILFALGVGDRVVATDDGSDHPRRPSPCPTSRHSRRSTSRRSSPWSPTSWLQVAFVHADRGDHPDARPRPAGRRPIRHVGRRRVRRHRAHRTATAPATQRRP